MVEREEHKLLSGTFSLSELKNCLNYQKKDNDTDNMSCGNSHKKLQVL